MPTAAPVCWHGAGRRRNEMTRLLLLVPRDLAADLEWLRIDADGSVLERGHASGLPAGSRGLLVAPGATTRTHWIGQTAHSPAQARAVATRSDERRVGKGCVRPLKSRWSAYP